MPYKYDDYDFDNCKGCKQLHMAHIMKFGYCLKCLKDSTLTLDYRRLMK